MTDDIFQTLESNLEPLEKKCPRCGKASANKSNPSGRCSACLKKLAANKKKPGHWQRAQTKADDALRRQKGKNGTAHKKSSGLGSRKSIVKQTQAAEKRTGEKLSPDRKDNSKGYASSNTRMVPEKLNRGRHHVDPKKLAAWRKKVKKSEIELDDLYTLIKAKAFETQNEELIKAIKDLSPEGLEELLIKEAAPKLEQAPHPLDEHIGKVHTVEIHPDIDHLYRAKGLIKENNRPHLHISDFKQADFPSDIIKKIPRDAHGKVTPEMIDEHIASLPKQKVNIELQPYTWTSQQHRNGPQYVAKMQLHPSSLLTMKPEHKELWDQISKDQHSFNDKEPDNQFGWARIDAHSKPDHWHLDEIQSDFQTKDKIDDKSLRARELIGDRKQREIIDEALKDPTHALHDDAHAYKKLSDKHKEDIKTLPTKVKTTEEALHSKKIFDQRDLLDQMDLDLRDKAKDEIEKRLGKPVESKDMLPYLSHGHNDPQHAIHSAINALGRKLGIKSLSMDTPEDQSRQSNLSNVNSENDDRDIDYDNWTSDQQSHLDDVHTPDFFNEASKNAPNPNLRSALQKLGYDTFHSGLLNSAGSSEPQESIFDAMNYDRDKLSAPEQHAISEYVRNMIDTGPSMYDDKYRIGEPPSKDKHKNFDMSKLPIHQLNTYHKRPRKLGMKRVDKKELLGEHPSDKAEEVQYMNLHKKLQIILDLIKAKTNK